MNDPGEWSEARRDAVDQQRERQSNTVVTKALRADALHTVKRRLAGVEQVEARAWVRNRRRTRRDLVSLIERLEPDRKGTIK